VGIAEVVPLSKIDPTIKIRSGELAVEMLVVAKETVGTELLMLV
jgi:hypothetical protein